MYYETALISKKVLRTGVQKAYCKKLFELGVAVQNYNVKFTAANRQLNWL